MQKNKTARLLKLSEIFYSLILAKKMISTNHEQFLHLNLFEKIAYNFLQDHTNLFLQAKI